MGPAAPAMHHVRVTDEAPLTAVEPIAVEPAVHESTVRERLSGAGLSAERIDQHLAAGRVRVDGELVDDLDQSAPAPARVVLGAP